MCDGDNGLFKMIGFIEVAATRMEEEIGDWTRV